MTAIVEPTLNRSPTVASELLQETSHALAVHRSRKRISPFHLYTPRTSADAVAILRKRPDACLLAGGIDVINRMKAGQVYADVVFVGRIARLRTIDVEPAALTVGAAVTHHELATSAAVAGTLPALATTWAEIANPRIRFSGTVGGNLMARNADYEAAPILAAAGADLCFASPDGPQTVACTDYFRAHRQNPAWLLETIRIPHGHKLRLHYDRSLKGVAGVVLALTMDDGLIVRARACVSWAYRTLHCADLPLETPTAAPALASAADDMARAWAAKLPAPIENHLASGAYRRRVLEVQLRRAIAHLAQGDGA